MKSSYVLIVGCGDLGIRCGTLLLEKDWSVAGVRRNTATLPQRITRHSADYTQAGSLDFIADEQPDYILATFNPFDRSVAGYKAGFGSGMANLLAGLGQHRPKHIIMTSSTRVFGESAGGWVDESSELSLEDPWAQEMIAAEKRLMSSGYNASVVRFAGIYGIPGGRLLSRVRRGELCPPEPISYTNRIHRDDCGGFLAHLLQQLQGGEELERLYIGADDEPAPRYEVESWLAQEMGLQDRAYGFAADQPTRHNKSGHRRCRNQVMRASGYQLLYPTYRDGYRDLLEAD
jgi:nucleoside-diphosphate-sugar epimerase